MDSQSKTRFLVYPKLPNAGLGNMLLVWANAIAFAHINDFQVIAPNWRSLKIGPYLRREKNKRYYGNLFSNYQYMHQWNYWITNFNRKAVFHNPNLSVIELDERRSLGLDYCLYLFVFDLIPHWSDYFVGLKNHSTVIKEKLIASIRPKIFEAIEQRPSPEIGVHIRMGDFRALQLGEDFAKLGSVRTPMIWYVDVLQSVRKTAGYEVPITLFSDGNADELEDLLKLPNVLLAPPASALSDMLTLSRSKLLVTSAGSTFSGWASYLGQCPTIWHPAHFHSGVFCEEVSQRTFEGGFDPISMAMPDLLTQNIQMLVR